jgi:hypothetical protein
MTPILGTSLKAVGFVSSVLRYFRTREQRSADTTIRDYVEWVRRQEHLQTTEGLKDIVDALDTNKKMFGELFSDIKQQVDLLTRVASHVERLPKIEEHVAKLVAAMESEASNAKERHRLLVSLKLLDAIAGQAKGTGVSINSLPNPEAAAAGGTILLRWRTGDRSTDLLLAEFVGGVLDNRIGIVLNSDSSFLARVLDDLGSSSVIRSRPMGFDRHTHVAVTWTYEGFSLWVQDELAGTSRIPGGLRRLGPYLFVGIDIDGLIGATTIRQGYIVDGHIGLNLERQGIWRGNKISDVALFNRVLPDDRIRELARVSQLEADDMKRCCDPALEHSFGTLRSLAGTTRD